MNHLEQLVSEWLQYKGYFVRVAIPVSPRPNGGYEGELDVVGFNAAKEHLIHVECSVDAWSKDVRAKRFQDKFDRGRRYVDKVFKGFSIPKELDQVLVHQAMGRSSARSVGGGRLVRVRELIHEIYADFEVNEVSLASGAISSNLPILRTLLIAKDAGAEKPGEHRLLPP